MFICDRPENTVVTRPVHSCVFHQGDFISVPNVGAHVVYRGADGKCNARAQAEPRAVASRRRPPLQLVMALACRSSPLSRQQQRERAAAAATATWCGREQRQYLCTSRVVEPTCQLARRRPGREEVARSPSSYRRYFCFVGSRRRT